MGSRRSHRAHGDEAPAWRRIRTIPAGYPKRRACGSPRRFHVRPFVLSSMERHAHISGRTHCLSPIAVMHQRRGTPVTSVDLTDSRIAHQAEKYQKMLQHLQGNILKGHGRDYSVHLFLKFRSEPRVVRDWVRAFGDRYVTSARRQLKETDEFRTYGIPGGLFGNFFLSAKGYPVPDAGRARLQHPSPISRI
jgi:hypothetical protein